MIDASKRPQFSWRKAFLIRHDKVLVGSAQPAPVQALDMDYTVGHTAAPKHIQKSQIPGPGNGRVYSGLGQRALEDTDIPIKSETVTSGNYEVSHDGLFG